MDGRLVHFYAEEASFSVPAGRYTVRAFCGMEYLENRVEITVAAAAPTRVSIDLERWIDPETMTWYSGESHIHANYGYGHWHR